MTNVSHRDSTVNYVWRYTTDQATPQVDSCCIAVIGVGEAGCKTVSRLVDSSISSAKCIAMDTDANHLSISKATQKILIGEKLTDGLGVGWNPELGRAAIEESRKHVEDLLAGIDIVFVTAGLGDGTGAGAAPIVAEIARQKGVVTIAVLTLPFRAEKDGGICAARALSEIRKQCDTVVVIDGDKLAQLLPNIPRGEAFRVADQVLANMIKEIVETISTPSLINFDFSNFKTIIAHGGMAVVGVGESNAPNRAEQAVRNALSNPLFDVDWAGATGALVHVIGDNNMTIEEANRVGEIVSEMMDRNALVIWGATVNPQQMGTLKVTLVMTGVNSAQNPRSIGTIAPELFNLEPYGESEGTVDIRLDLYQMENDSQ